MVKEYYSPYMGAGRIFLRIVRHQRQTVVYDRIFAVDHSSFKYPKSWAHSRAGALDAGVVTGDYIVACAAVDEVSGVIAAGHIVAAIDVVIVVATPN